MSDPIKGLTVTVGGEELAEMCNTQAAFHKKRMEFYRGEYDRMIEANISAPKDPGSHRHYTGNIDPAEQMRDKVHEHTAKLAKLAFMATHLDPQGRYLLSDGDLYTLGIGV